VKSIVLVNMDSTARGILEEVLEQGGTRTTDVQDLLTVAFAHAKVAIEKETRRAAEVAA
jgi:CheY-like chemotaxis protein